MDMDMGMTRLEGRWETLKPGERLADGWSGL